MSRDVELKQGPAYEHVLDIIHLNIRSIRHKLHLLNTFLHDFDIACFTKTHLDDKILDEEVKLDGFNSIYRKDRNSFGGGVMIYLSNAIPARRCVDFEPNNIECIWLEIEDPTCKYFLFCLYGPPHTNSIFRKTLSWSLDKFK